MNLTSLKLETVNLKRRFINNSILVYNVVVLQRLAYYADSLEIIVMVNVVKIDF